MSSLAEYFGWTGKVEKEELPEIFPMPILQSEFVNTDVITIYVKVLTDVLERTHGLTDEQIPVMWDNCVKSAKSEGLITMLAKGMAEKSDLYLVYDPGIGIVRHATSAEQAKIKVDYETAASSSSGVFISFKGYRRTDMVKLYSSLEYCTIAALNRSLNISSAPQFKFSDLRASVALTDAPKAEVQAMAIARALQAGKPIMIDAKDSVETATPDLSATEKSIDFIADKLAFYLGMPKAYITGEQTGGIGSTGENDMRAVERGLKNYFYSVLKPAVEEIFGGKVSYKSQDFRNIDGALEILKTFQLTDEAFLSAENKLKIVNQAFDLPEDAVGDPVPEPVLAPVAAVPAAPFVPGKKQVTQ